MKPSKLKLSIREKIRKPKPISLLSYQPNNFFVKIYASKITLDYLNKNNNQKKYETIQNKTLKPKISINKSIALSSFNTHIFPANSLEINSSFSNNISNKDYYLHKKELNSFSLGKQKSSKRNAFRNYQINSNYINKSLNYDFVKLNNKNKIDKNIDNISLNKKKKSKKNNKKLSHVSIIDSNSIDTIKTYPKNLTINYTISNNDTNKKVNLFKLQKINTNREKKIKEKVHKINSTKLPKQKSGNKKMKKNFDTLLAPSKYNIQKIYKKIHTKKEGSLFGISYNKNSSKNFSMFLNDSVNKKNIKNKSFRVGINEQKRIHSLNKFHNIFKKFQNSSTNKSVKIKDITMIKRNSIKINLFPDVPNNREKSIKKKTKNINKSKNHQKKINKKFSRKIHVFSLIQKNNKKKNEKTINGENINIKTKDDFLNISFILNENNNNDKTEIDKFDDMNEIIKKINYDQENKNEINMFTISNENKSYNKFREKFNKIFENDITRKKKYYSANINKIKYKKDFRRILNITNKFNSKLYSANK